MKVIKPEKMVVDRIISYVCDCCGRIESPGSVEFQEYLSINWTGGYSSVFGDEQELEIQLCQYCINALLGKYIQYK